MKDLSVALHIKKQSKKKMANGGSVKEESRPMPESKNNDAKNISQNDHMKATPQEKWTDNPTVKQAQKMTVAPKKHPMMAESSVIRTKLRDQEDDLMALKPDGYKNQPPKAYDEEMPERKGPSVPALGMKKMAEGGSVSIQKELYDEPMEEAADEKHASLAAAIMAKRKMMAEGGEVDLHLNEDEQPTDFDDLNQDAVDYHENDIDSAKQPMDSNLHGDTIESDVHDLVSKIRAKIKKGM